MWPGNHKQEEYVPGGETPILVVTGRNRRAWSHFIYRLFWIKKALFFPILLSLGALCKELSTETKPSHCQTMLKTAFDAKHL